MERKVFVLVISALVYSISAEEHEIRGRIFNGQVAVMGQFKYMAALVVCRFSLDNPPDCGFCGGTIIAQNWILTAAHCLEERETAYIYLGSLDRDNAVVSYKVGEYHFFSHPEYNPNTVENDIALIVINDSFECDKIEFARMPHPGTSVVKGDVATAMGWGRINDNGDSTRRLRWTHLEAITNESCGQYFEEKIIDTNLCMRSYEPYGSPCVGDSGGPLVLRDTGEVIGVLSRVPEGNCTDNIPVVYARVTSYMPWITTTTGLHF